MANLLKRTNRTINAQNFRGVLDRVDPEPNTLYLYFGKDDAWADENNPDVPVESVTDEFATRDAAIGIKRITKTNTAFVIARHNWTSGTVYVEYDPDTADLFDEEFYIMSSSFKVYKCLDNNSGGASIVEPVGTSTSPVATGDGYTWKFMYDLSTSVQANFLTIDWLPVPSDGQKSAFQLSVESNASYSVGDPTGGHGSNAIMELGARSVMIEQTLEQDESGIFPTDDDFRQFGLWLNPALISTGSVATGTTYTMNDTSSDIDSTTGEILYVDNRKIITRNPDQSETFKMIMSF